MPLPLAYTPLNMRYRGLGVRTNTPPKAAQRGPGGAQIIGMLEPLMDKAARELGVDRLALRRLNAPNADVEYGPRGSTLTSVFVKEAIDMGRELFGWEERIARSGQLNGTKRTGIGVGVSPYTAGSTQFDGLLVIRPDGIVQIQQGLGNLGTNSNFDTARAAADVLGVEWSQVEVVFRRHRVATCLGVRSRRVASRPMPIRGQTTPPGLDAKQKLQEIAARDLGGRPEDYETSDGRVYRRSNPSQGNDPGACRDTGDRARRTVQRRGVQRRPQRHDQGRPLPRWLARAWWRRRKTTLAVRNSEGNNRGLSALPRWSWTSRLARSM